MEQGHLWNDDPEERKRVSTRISPSIRRFCDHKYQQPDRRFHAEDLRGWVRRETGILAPASADRILRDLRQKGVIDYRILSRRESLYEITAVQGEAAAKSAGEGAK